MPLSENSGCLFFVSFGPNGSLAFLRGLGKLASAKQHHPGREDLVALFPSCIPSPGGSFPLLLHAFFYILGIPILRGTRNLTWTLVEG